MAIVYLCTFIKEPPKKKFELLRPEDRLEKLTPLSYISAFFKTFVWTPLVNMVNTMTKRRSGIFKMHQETDSAKNLTLFVGNLRFLLLLQIIVYFLYWFSEGDGEINYLFMIKVFKSTAKDYSIFLTVLNCLGVIALFLGKCTFSFK